MTQLNIKNFQKNKVKVLLAEDDRHNSEVASRFLMAVGYNVAVARDGVEVLEMARAERPDIILMDIRMPNLSGLEAIRRLRAIHSLNRVPIIVVTALAMPNDRSECLAAGADDYLCKPFRLVELHKAIEQQLARTQEETPQVFSNGLEVLSNGPQG